MNTLSLNAVNVGRVENPTLREILTSVLFPQRRVQMSYGNYNDYGNYDDVSYANYSDYGNYDDQGGSYGNYNDYGNYSDVSYGNYNDYSSFASSK